MQIYLEQPKDVHYHGVEGHPKTGSEHIAEQDHFVCTRMSDGLTRRWSPDTVCNVLPPRGRARLHLAAF